MSYILTKMTDIIEFNPRESIAKKQVCKKVPMEYLQPFTRQISGYEEAPYAGGTKFRNNDTIMARITPCLENGKTAFVKGFAENEVIFGSTEYIVMRAIPGSSDPTFIYYLAISPSFREVAIKSMVGSSGRQRVQQDVLENLELVLPDYDTQVRVGKVLASFDDKIELNAQINHNLEEQAALIFADWLQDCTESITIGDLSTNILDYTPIDNGLVRLLNSSDVTEGIFPDTPLVPNANLKGHFKKRFQLGDILYSEIRPRNHHYGFVLFDASEYIASTRLMVIRALDYKVSPAMLYQYLLLPSVEAEFVLKTESRSGTFPQGNYADMASIKIPYAPVKTQNMVSSTLTKIRQTIANNQLENQQLSELRDSLLPKLMSGEIDVSEVEV